MDTIVKIFKKWQENILKNLLTENSVSYIIKVP